MNLEENHETEIEFLNREISILSSIFHQEESDQKKNEHELKAEVQSD
jgi:hypothetical protein